MTFSELIDSFKAKQNELIQLNMELKKQEALLQEATDKFIEENKGKVNEAGKAYQAKMTEYKLACKEQFGLADGDQINILEVVQTIKKVQGLE